MDLPQWVVGALRSIGVEHVVWASAATIGAVVALRGVPRLRQWARLRRYVRRLMRVANPVIVVASGSISKSIEAESNVLRGLKEYCDGVSIRLLFVPTSRGGVEDSSGRWHGLDDVKRFNPPYTVVVPVAAGLKSYSAARRQRHVELAMARRGVGMVAERIKAYSQRNPVAVVLIGAPNAKDRMRGLTSISTVRVFDELLRDVASSRILMVVTDAAR